MATVSRADWHERIKAIGREYEVARHAIDGYITALEHGGTDLPPNTNRHDANTVRDNLEGTYLIRLFAAFESGLRSFWGSVKKTTPPAKDLIDGLAARCRVTSDTLDDVHRVRVYRNSLVHEGDAAVESVPLAEAQPFLSKFLARLPPNWVTEE